VRGIAALPFRAPFAEDRRTRRRPRSAPVDSIATRSVILRTDQDLAQDNGATRDALLRFPAKKRKKKKEILKKRKKKKKKKKKKKAPTLGICKLWRARASSRCRTARRSGTTDGPRHRPCAHLFEERAGSPSLGPRKSACQGEAMTGRTREGARVSLAERIKEGMIRPCMDDASMHGVRKLRCNGLEFSKGDSSKKGGDSAPISSSQRSLSLVLYNHRLRI